MDLTTLSANINLLVLIATGTVTLGGIAWRYIIHPLSRVVKEFRPNGGSSFRDAMNRMEAGIESVNNKVDIVSQRQLLRDGFEEKGLWESEADGRWIAANPAMGHLAGVAPSDLMGMAWKTHIHPRHRNEVIGSWQSAVTDVRPFVLDFEFVNGTTVRWTGKPMISQKGELLRWVGECEEKTS